MANKEEKPTQQLAVANQNQNALVFDTIEHFNNAQRMCMCLSTANMLPKHFQGEANLGNCMIALEIAQRGQIPVMEVFQNLVPVNGKISWLAQYLIGRVNTCGRYSTLTWESEGDGTEKWRMRARAVELATGEVLTGSWVSLEMARAENWGAKWKTMPEQMLRYRSAAFWVRVFSPNIAMGIPMKEEVEDVAFEEVKPADPETKAQKNAAALDALQQAIGKKKPEPPVDRTESPADAPKQAQPTNGQSKPIVAITVEPENPQPENPNGNTYQSELEKAKRNLGITKPENGAQLDFESGEQ